MASTVLATILQSCGEMKETQAPCQRLHRRLAGIFTQLQTLEAAKTLPSTEALGKYAGMLRKYRDFLRQHRLNPLYARVVHHERTMTTLKMLHEDVDALVVVLGLSNDEKGQWMQQWEKDGEGVRHYLHGMIETMDFGDPREARDKRIQLEAMTVLKYEMDKPVKHSEATLTLIKKLYEALVHAGFNEVQCIPHWFLPREEVEYDREPFVCGSLGVFHHGTLSRGVKVDIKKLLIDEAFMSEASREQLVVDLDRWHTLDHPNVLKMLSACHVSSPPIIVCEATPEGSAPMYLGSSKTREHRIWPLLYAAALGLEHLHLNGITHGDLRLSNILVDSTGNPRLAYFGWNSIRLLSPELSSQTPCSRAGQLRWRAPECLKRKPTAYSDIYSLAMCIVEGVTGEQPFACADDDTVYRLLRDGEMFEKPEEINEHVWDLVQSMTRRDPTERCSLDTVIAALKKFAMETAPINREHLNATYGDAKGLANRDNLADCSHNVSTEERDAIFVDGQTSVSSLLSASQRGTKDVQECALSRLYQRTDDAADCEIVLQAGGVSLLSAIIANESTERASQLYGFGCLRRLYVSTGEVSSSVIDEAKANISVPTLSEVDQMLEPLKLPIEDPGLALRALELATCLVDVSSESCQALVSEGFIRLVVDVLGLAHDDVSAAVLVAVDTLAAAHAFNSVTLQTASVIPKLMILLVGKDVKHQYQAMVALSSICEYCRDSHEIIKDCEGIVSIIAVLRGEREDLAILAAQVLGHLSASPSMCHVLESAGVVNELVLMAQGTEEDVRVEAVIALSRISQHCQQALRRMNDPHVLASAVEAFNVGNDNERVSLTRAFAILAEDPMASQHIERSGAIDELLKSLRSGTNDQRLYAITALASLTKSSFDSVGLVANAKYGIETLVSLLEHNDDRVNTMATKTLGNLALSVAACVVIESTPAIKYLVKTIQDGTQHQINHAAITLSHMCQYGETSIRQIMESNGVRPLVGILNGSDDTRVPNSLLTAVASTLPALAAAGAITSALLRETSLVPQLNVFLDCQDPKLRTSAVGAVASLCEHIPGCHSILLECNAIKPLISCLSSNDDIVECSAARALGFFSSCVPACDAMLVERVDEELVRIIQRGTMNVKIEATVALCMICEQSVRTRVWLQNEDVFDVLLKILAFGSPYQAVHALRALNYATRDVLVCQRMETPAVIQHLVQFIRSGSRDNKRCALHILVNLTELGADSLILVTEADVIEQALAVLRKEDDGLKITAARLLGRLALYTPASRIMEKTDVVDHLVNELRSSTEELKIYSLQTLGNVCAHSDACCLRLQAIDGVGLLIDRLRRAHSSLSDAMLKVLHALFSCTTTRSAVLEAGVAELLLDVIEAGSTESVIRLVLDMTSDDLVCKLMINAGAIDCFTGILKRGTDEEKENALFALPNFTRDRDGRRELLSSSAPTLVVQLVVHGSASVQRCAVRTLGGLAVDHALVHDIIRARGIFTVVDHLRSADNEMMADALRTLDIIASVDDAACFRIAQAGIAPLLINIVENSTTLKVIADSILRRLADVVWMLDVDGSLVRTLVNQLHVGSDQLKAHAKEVFRTLNGNPTELASCVAGFVTSLVSLAGTETLEDRRDVLLSLKAVALSPICKLSLLRAGGVDVFLQAVNDGDEVVSTTAVDALCAMVEDAEVATFVANKFEFKDLVVPGRRYEWGRKMVQYLLRNESAEFKDLVAGLSSIVKHRSTHPCSPQVQNCVDSAWLSILSKDSEQVLLQVTRLVELLVLHSRTCVGGDNSAIQMLCGLASYNVYHRVVVKAGVVETLTALVCQSDVNAATASVALAELARYDEDVRVRVVNSGGIGVLVEMARVGNAATQSAAVAALSSLAPSPIAGSAIRLLGGIEALETLTRSPDPKRRADSRRAVRVLRISARYHTENATFDDVISVESKVNHQEVSNGETPDKELSGEGEEDGYSDSYCSDGETR